MTPPDQNPFVTATGGKGNLLWNQQPSTRSSTRQQNPTSNPIEEAAIIRETISQFPMATTDEAWMEQVHQWRIKHGDAGRVTKHSGFPLRPGGAPPGSNECYRCGKAGHTRAACTSPLNDCIPAKEAIFRSICGSILRGTHQQSTAVNHVGVVDTDSDWLWKENMQQGNGEGPSA